MNDNVLYLTQRLIDTCLREDLFGLVSQGAFINALPNKLNINAYGADQTWLAFSTQDLNLYLPVTPFITCSDGSTA